MILWGEAKNDVSFAEGASSSASATRALTRPEQPYQALLATQTNLVLAAVVVCGAGGVALTLTLAIVFTAAALARDVAVGDHLAIFGAVAGVLKGRLTLAVAAR